ASDLARRGRSHENAFGLGVSHCQFGEINIGLRCRPVLPVNSARTCRPMLEWRSKLLEQRGKFGEFVVTGAEGRRAWTFVTSQPAHHVYGVIRAALFAVVDDVEAAFDLFIRDITNCLAYRGLQFSAVPARVFLLG